MISGVSCLSCSHINMYSASWSNSAYLYMSTARVTESFILCHSQYRQTDRVIDTTKLVDKERMVLIVIGRKWSCMRSQNVNPSSRHLSSSSTLVTCLCRPRPLCVSVCPRAYLPNYNVTCLCRPRPLCRCSSSQTSTTWSTCVRSASATREPTSFPNSSSRTSSTSGSSTPRGTIYSVSYARSLEPLA